jgi:hypothetical protein
VSLECLEPLVDRGILFAEDLHYTAGQFDILNDSATRIFSRETIGGMLATGLEKEHSATYLIVWALYSLLRAARSTADQIGWREAIQSAARGITVLRFWKTVDPDSVHGNLLLSFELLFHSVVYYAVIVKAHWPQEAYRGLRYLSTVGLEMLFSVARGFGGVNSNIINFTIRV